MDSRQSCRNGKLGRHPGFRSLDIPDTNSYKSKVTQGEEKGKHSVTLGVKTWGHRIVKCGAGFPAGHDRHFSSAGWKAFPTKTAPAPERLNTYGRGRIALDIEGMN
jgi:hypothetical protein